MACKKTDFMWGEYSQGLVFRFIRGIFYRFSPFVFLRILSRNDTKELLGLLYVSYRPTARERSVSTFNLTAFRSRFFGATPTQGGEVFACIVIGGKYSAYVILSEAKNLERTACFLCGRPHRYTRFAYALSV